MTGHSHLFSWESGNLAGQEARSENRTYLARAGSDLLGAVVRSESRFQGGSRGEGQHESERGGVPSKVSELVLR